MSGLVIAFELEPCLIPSFRFQIKDDIKAARRTDSTLRSLRRVNEDSALIWNWNHSAFGPPLPVGEGLISIPAPHGSFAVWLCTARTSACLWIKMS